jgi:hypothetical protein
LRRRSRAIFVVRSRDVASEVDRLDEGLRSSFATPLEFRSRGYGRAVTTGAIEAAFEAGTDLAWLQASPLGQPVYQAMGFRQVATYLLLWRPASEPKLGDPSPRAKTTRSSPGYS